MKNTIKILSGFLAVIFIYFVISGFVDNLTKSSNHSTANIPFSVQTNPYQKDFVNYLLNFGYDPGTPKMWILSNINKFKYLNFNGVHSYANAVWDTTYGKFDVPLSSSQISSVNSSMNIVYNNGLKGIYDRRKLSDLCGGQRVEYEVASSTGSTTVNDGFCWQQRDNNTCSYTTDSGRTVLYCDTASKNAGYIAKNIYQNGQHSDLLDWQWNDRSTWFLLPTMRIKQSDFSSSSSVPVVAIVTYNFNNQRIDSIIIQVQNFSNNLGNYSGEYKNGYLFTSQPTALTIQGGENTGELNHGWTNFVNPSTGAFARNCNVDFKIYWFDKVDVWFDKLVVQNATAASLFSGFDDPKINDEVSNFVRNENYTFFVDEMTYSNIPCCKYVLDKAKSINPNVKISFAQTNNLNIMGIKNNPFLTYKAFLEKVNPDMISFDAHTIEGTNRQHLPDVFNHTVLENNHVNTSDPSIYLQWLDTPEDYNEYLQKRAFGDASSAGISDETSFNFWGMDDKPMPWGSFVYQVSKAKQYLTEISPDTKIIMQPQIHTLLDKAPADPYFKVWGLREPMNEEIQALAGISIAHGADGLCWFVFQSIKFNQTTVFDNPYRMSSINAGDDHYHYGFTEIADTATRWENLYGQNKWEYVRSMNQKILNWKPTLDKINWAEGHSVHTDGANHNLVNDIQSIVPGVSGQNSCSNDYQTDDFPSGPYMDCPEERYWEMGVFNPVDASDKAKYFMMVNRRCIPETPTYDGDYRQLKVKFNASNLPAFNNWKVIDVNTNATVVTINKNSGTYYDFGQFLPGEGKLYRIVPVMQEGGTFVVNESISGVSFNFNAPVNTNGKNLTIGGGVHIYLKDTCQLKMNGGNFICGTYTDDEGNPKSVDLRGQGSSKWRGLSLNNMDTVSVENTLIYNVDSTASDTKYGVSVINSKVINIDNCNVYNSGSSAGGIFVYYNTYVIMSPTLNITRNDVRISTSNYDGVHIRPYSWLTMTPYIYSNKIINTSTGGGRYGIYGFSLEGTAIKNNYIENFSNGILTWYSSLDLFENTIDTKNISNGWDLYGIVSEYNLSNAYESRLGGSNVLTTLNGRNVCVDALDINIADGNNIFNVNDSAGFHMLGYFPTSYPSNVDPPEIYAGGNCFKVEGIEDIKVHCDWLDLRDIQFDFGSSSCAGSPNYCDYYIGGNPTDTIWIECGSGMGGGQKNSVLVSAPQENAYKQLYDSLSINMRKRQYGLAAEKCMTLLNNYPDSAKTINAVDKLYHTALANDVVSEIKSYYESFIQSHPNNTHIIQRMFYYIQKAKARLGQYESAMQGFQTIMNQFPTSYEGLAAKWDYMATQLLDSLNGQGGGEKEVISDEQMTDEQRHERLVSLVEDPLDKYDKKKFTKEDRKVIVNNIVNSFEDKKTKETKRVKELEVKVFMNEATKSETQEYKTKKVLKEVVRPQTVNTISEHINAVQGDIEKVFSVRKNTKDVDNKTIAVIPLEYKLNQNYPNPFNPSTKINYELKNPGYVSLKIYDLLGREIAELVNETKDAGRYTIDFNASKYMMASGIYFYRIKAGDFVDTKRMVLIK